MRLPLQITFRGMEASDAITARIRERAEELDRLSDRIVACHVVVDSGQGHQRKGRIHHVRVTLTVPGGEIAVTRDPPEHHAHEDMNVAIRDAFDATRRQLEDHLRRHHGQVKTHDLPDHGAVSRLFPGQGYGFITAPAGQEIYMHRNSVLNGGFDALRIGDAVIYVVDPEDGGEGPQASSVVAVGKRGPAAPFS
jgi:ribosome-associated translation inhibitor RaiA